MGRKGSATLANVALSRKNDHQGSIVITIDYFSDVLCVWAYGGQIRLEELQREFAGDILVRQHFMPLFADTRVRIGEGWKDKGGFVGFGQHMQEVCRQWDHIRLHADVWTECRPTSCTSAHVFLKAAGLCLDLESVDENSDAEACARFERLVVRVRTAFFEQARDISSLPVLLDLLQSGDPGRGDVVRRIESGEAYAALHRDEQLLKDHGVVGSPTYVFNDGRQLLYGNVGYRIIASNLRELMSAHRVEGEPSWC
jgi:predicted DsbA family dithiol-disulfide isomerase